MNFQWRIDYQKMLDEVEISRFEKAMALIGITEGVVVDAYTMTVGGPVLSSAFVFNNDFIVEVDFLGKHLTFDSTSTALLLNYRVKFGEHDGTTEDVNPDSTNDAPNPDLPKTTKYAQLILRHTEGLMSRLSYFGPDLDEWLAFAIKAYPPTHLFR